MLVVVEVRALFLVVIPHYVRRVRRHPAHGLAVRGWLLYRRRVVRQQGHVGPGGDGTATEPSTRQAVH